MRRFCEPNLSINPGAKIVTLTERLTRTYEKYRVLMTVSYPNVSRVRSINQRTRKILQNRVIPVHKKPPNDAELLELIFSIS